MNARPAFDPDPARAPRLPTWRPFAAVLQRELLKLARQRARLLASLVRPLIWLFVIGAGLGAVMARHGVVDYQRFLVPGVLAMTLLFGAMLAALATVYDKESGVMRLLVIAPLAHPWLVLARTLAAACSALAQGALLLAVLWVLRMLPPDASAGTLAAGMLVTALTCAALGMAVASFSGTLENYAVMMNMVIFPVYFISGALYPVAMLPPYLRILALANPFTYGVDLLKHGLAAPAADFGQAEFGMVTDCAAAAGFVVIALALACARFARAAACEPLVHPRTGPRAR